MNEEKRMIKNIGFHYNRRLTRGGYTRTMKIARNIRNVDTSIMSERQYIRADIVA